MKSGQSNARGFTLIELLVVVSMLGVLFSLMQPVLSRAKSKAKRAVCINNLKQVNLAVQTYAEDHQGILPFTNKVRVYYVFQVGFRDVELGPEPLRLPIVTVPPQRSPLICPADWWAFGQERRWERPMQAYFKGGVKLRNVISYGFNGDNLETNLATGLTYLGIAGKNLASIVEPSRTVLVAEQTAFSGGTSMHDPPKSAGPLPDQPSMMSFVDGHVSYLKVFYIDEFGKRASFYDPPPGYDYRWSNP